MKSQKLKCYRDKLPTFAPFVTVLLRSVCICISLPSPHFSPSLCVVRPLTAIPICGAVDDDETICGQGEAPKAMQHLLPFANSNHVGRRPNIPPPIPSLSLLLYAKTMTSKVSCKRWKGERGIWGSLTPHKVFWQCETHPSMSHEV